VTSEDAPSASAAATGGCAITRRAQPTCPAAAPRVTPVLWISQAPSEYAASAAGRCPAADADSSAARTAVSTAASRVVE